jgi:hypothetical protein
MQMRRNPGIRSVGYEGSKKSRREFPGRDVVYFLGIGSDEIIGGPD